MTTGNVLGGIGAVVGAFFGQPALGYAIGSTLGNAIDPVKIQGPQLSDLKVQVSTYGNFIPIIYGSYRCAGNVIYSTELIPTTNDSSGKGGPVIETTTYSVNCAVALSGMQIAGVRRIWANGTLIYDVSATSDAGTLVASNAAVGTFTVYTGTETQLPDPTMEAALGAGNVSAHRGMAYVVLGGFQLANYGNRIPNLEFEVIAAATPISYRPLFLSSSMPIQFGRSGADGVGRPIILSISGGVVRIGVIGSWIVYLYDSNGNYLGKDSRSDAETVYPSGTPIGIWDGVMVTYSATNLSAPVAGGLVINVGPWGAWRSSAVPGNEYLGGAALSSDGKNLMIMTAPSTATSGEKIVDKWYLVSQDGSINSQGTISPAADIFSFGFGNSTTYHFGCSSLEGDLKNLWVAYGAGAAPIYNYQIDSSSNLALAHTFSDVLTAGAPTYPSIFADSGVAVAVGGLNFAVVTRQPSLNVNPVPLSTIVTDLCERSELSDIDVSELTDSVDGFAITNLTTARANMQQLQQAYFFDAVESDDIFKFVKRGDAPVAAIPWADLAAMQSTDTPKDPLSIQRAQEVDLPATLTVNYANINGDYQQGSESQRRLVTQSTQTVVQSLAIAMTPDKGAQIADVLMFNAFTGRTTFKFSTSRKYSQLQPTDPITIIGPTANYSLRITTKNENGPILEFEAVAEDGTVYTSSAVGATNQPGQVGIVSPGPTNIQMLDIPIIRDQDDDTGFYAAMAGYRPTWKGATLFRSPDDVTYAMLDSVQKSAVIGVCDTVLGNWTGGNIFDEINSITVSLNSGQLASDTMLNVLNGSNAAVIGNEIIQFKNAVLISANQYLVSGLLRGRRGTEQFIGTHGATERFVLLGMAGTLRPNEGASAIGAIRFYRAVSFGSLLNQSGSYNFANTGAGAKPYSVSHVGGGKQSNGDFLINWIRRGRLDNNWRDAVDVPVGEASESYQVDILNGPAVIRTLTSTSPAATYTSAMQTTDFGSVQSTLSAVIYQMSASVGRGFPASKTY